MARFLYILLTAASATALQPLTWSTCGTLECATLTVPLEYDVASASTAEANIALVRFKATVEPAKRLGSLLVNPGGPGASGVQFVKAGAGAAISTLSGGLYDIIGWDPRGVGESTPALQCFASAGAEYDFSNSFPTGPKLWLGMFNNSTYDSQVQQAISEFDSTVASLAKACASEGTSALYTSSAAYVARDMAAILDATDGIGSKLNYWGFSYGTVYLAEFIQAFPNRVGRTIADGVVNIEANALPYTSQLPNDQVSVRAALNDWISFCQKAGSANCPLLTPPAGVTAGLAQRIDKIFEDLFRNPVVINGLPIGIEIITAIIWSFIRVPVTWAKISTVLQGLEVRDATILFDILVGLAEAAPTDSSAPGVGTFSEYPLNCIDNAASSSITLQKVIDLTKSLSISENTPLLSAGLTPITFCRNFPDKRPKVANAGISLLSQTDLILSAAQTTVLIVSPDHDPTTPLISARALRKLLPKSSKIAIRGGSGHTTPSIASLSLSRTILDFLTLGATPKDNLYHPVDQNLFPAGSGQGLVTSASFNGTSYSSADSSLLQATYSIILAFLAL